MTRALLVLAVAFGAVACDPPCQRTCRKVLDCGNLSTDRLALDACVSDCSLQEQLYDDWEDDAKKDLFKDHKRCLVQSTCDEIAAGECYEGYEALFVFDPEATSSAVGSTPPTSPVE